MKQPPQMHYVITLQWATPPNAPVTSGQAATTLREGAMATATREGVVDPVPGTTRQAVFLDVVAHTRKRIGVPEGAPVSVLFWSLKRNNV